ncbi:MAG TPA: SGNH/GDSL hydrolase family protein [Solirubrobacteraceae bacterium]|nr:SGNH/GDSL hydrolase family protein [Solirubrobacteraceae bacterium]
MRPLRLLKRAVLSVLAGVVLLIVVAVVIGELNKKSITVPGCTAEHWVGTWAADPSDALDGGLVDQTVRLVLTPHLGGHQLRIHLSNRFSTKPVTIGRASIGLGQTGASLVAGSNHEITFGGQGSVTLPAGGDAVSDPVSLDFKSFEKLDVSLYTAETTGPSTEHLDGQQTSYATPPKTGDHTNDDAGGAFSIPTTERYYLDGIDVQALGSVGAVVALGDSITDGEGGPPDRDDRYPDALARRLLGAPGATELTTLDAGISGNEILTDAQASGAGQSALTRLNTDVIDEAGASDVIVLEGINDIGAGKASADQIIAGLEQIVTRVHAAGMQVLLGTLTPVAGIRTAGYATSEAEATRLAVNRFIRGPNGADGYVDFDRAIRDPTDPSRLNPAFDSGDHIHPNTAGRKAMADAVDLGSLRAPRCKAS